MKGFEQNLARLKNVAVTVAADNVPDEEGSAAIVMKFSDGTVLKSFYWRLVQDGRARLSSFDHQKLYGLPAPIDAKEKISAMLEGQICLNVHLDSETADGSREERVKTRICSFGSDSIRTETSASISCER